MRQRLRSPPPSDSTSPDKGGIPDEETVAHPGQQSWQRLPPTASWYVQGTLLQLPSSMLYWWVAVPLRLVSVNS